jgi:hypothetical protein
MRVSRVVCTVLMLCFALFAPESAEAQLISPGKLSSVHSELTGIRNCTNCHELRTRGISRDRCLACHEPLARRIATDAGVHGDAEFEECASCHLDHMGPDYELIRWDPAEFDHSETGHELEESHSTLECSDCHTSPLVRDRQVRVFKGRYGALNRTYLGLSSSCAGCHASDDPHNGGFDPQPCSDCHDQSDWGAAVDSFDHEQTQYPLTGQHRTVECNDCHRPGTRSGQAGNGGAYGGLKFASCADCHSDPHDGGMQATCTGCHSTTGWEGVRREDVEANFNHASVYPLEGVHAAADCMACHAERPDNDSEIRITHRQGSGLAYPAPVADRCSSCHLDLHGGELGSPPSGAVCSECHDQTAWYPSSFGISRHGIDTEFQLTGAHMATPCGSCHVDPIGAGQFTVEGDTCAACHDTGQPHGFQFEGRACDSCHEQTTFTITDFDHTVTSYALDGAHSSVACSNCHKPITEPEGQRVVRYRPLAAARCSDCHGE